MNQINTFQVYRMSLVSQFDVSEIVKVLPIGSSSTATYMVKVSHEASMQNMVICL